MVPTDYGWQLVDDILQPIWFKGAAIPGILLKKTDEDMAENDIETEKDTEIVSDSDSDETIIVGNECDTASLDELSDTDDEPWTEDSDSDPDEEDI